MCVKGDVWVCRTYLGGEGLDGIAAPCGGGCGDSACGWECSGVNAEGCSSEDK